MARSAAVGPQGRRAIGGLAVASPGPGSSDLLDVAILGQVALGYSPFIDRNRTVAATRLTVFPLRPDATLDVAQLLHAVGDVWPASGGSRLAQRRQREPAARPAAGEPVGQPDGRGAGLHGRPIRPARSTLVASARQRQHAAAEGPAERAAAARGAAVLQVFDHRSGRRPPASKRRRPVAPPAGVTRTIAHVQSGVRTVAEMEARFARGAHAVLGWPIDDAVSDHCGAHRQGERAARHAGDRRADPPRRQRGSDRAAREHAQARSRRWPSSCCATSTRRPSACASRSARSATPSCCSATSG